MMKTLSQLSVVVLLAFTAGAQAHAAKKGLEMNCKSTKGSVDNIIELSFEETDLEGQNCGTINSKITGADEFSTISTCFNGSLLSDENEILSTNTTLGLIKVTLLKDAKGYSLIKTLECSLNAKAYCTPGTTSVLADDVLSCSIQ